MRTQHLKSQTTIPQQHSTRSPQLIYWQRCLTLHPPLPGQHYSPAYSDVPGVQSINDASQQSSQAHFGNATLPALMKTEVPAADRHDSGVLHYSLTQELQRSVDGNDRTPLQQPRSQPQQQVGNYISQTPPQSNTDSPSESAAKATAARLRKACDSCSVRKVKCDESGPPCRACAALDIPCTFARPTKRRGPPNRHAAALKRQKLEEGYSGPPSPASPTNAAQALAALSSHTSAAQLSAESICSLDTLELLINDFFTYVHPLCPFPHEPSFREAWKRREDLTNKSFLALVASMIGALVASFPRKPRLHLKAQRKEKLFPNHMSLVSQCQHVCALARGPAYLEKERISVYDAATSYFLALTGVYTFRWRQGRLYFGECLTIIRVLGLHRTDEAISAQPLGGFPHLRSEEEHSDVRDNITIQIGRRIFWTMFVGVKTLQQLGAQFDELQIPPPTTTDPYPPLPLEVDDLYIFPTHIEPQPPGLLPMIAGFNANVKAFSSYNTLSTMETSWGIDHIIDWQRQKKVLKDSLAKCKNATASLPPELKVYIQGHGHHGRSQFPSAEPARSFLSLAGVHDDNLMDQTSEQRRHMQYEIQKANIYASSLATRSYIVQKYWNLVEAHVRLRSQQTPISRPTSPHSPSIGIVAAGIDGALPQHPPPTSSFDMTEQEFRDERETIVKDLLVVLGSIDQVSMEPNAESFVLKIRSIASTLLDAPDTMRGHMELQAKDYLAAFLEVLIRLEHVSANSETQQEDEAAELRSWANLREYQVKFDQQGGTFG
ncbi:hypothetical protein AMS68_005282 [Peltaster fructicola]|uniref:Zn(2)-C6 fungal-type domain-containing protein n=1 Tax=Peltaster fructicola TaxID=286661 RepID=A0A6H0XYM5_9PEZI|nr:hypothetical protein AMS68_005282 [Peltaster fructicola]